MAAQLVKLRLLQQRELLLLLLPLLLQPQRRKTQRSSQPMPRRPIGNAKNKGRSDW